MSTTNEKGTGGELAPAKGKMKTYLIIITILAAVLLFILIKPLFISEEEYLMNGFRSRIGTSRGFTVDSLHGEHMYSYVRVHLEPWLKHDLFDEYRFYNVDTAQEKVIGKIPIRSLNWNRNHLYNYRSTGMYGYILRELAGDTLTEWILHED